MALLELKPLVCLERLSRQTLFYRDYSSGFSALDFAPSVFNDGQVSSSRGGLLFASPSFTKAASSKMLNFYIDSFLLEGEEILFEARMSARQSFSAALPAEYVPRVQNIHADYRLGCSSFLVEDVQSQLQLGFLLTNEIIYAYYARSGEANFASAVPVKRRGMGPPGAVDNLDDLYKLGVSFNCHRNSVSWLIDGQTVLTHDRLGYRLLEQTFEGGGDDYLLRIDKVLMGFGHHTFLDHQRPGCFPLIDKGTAGCIVRRYNTGLAPCRPLSDYYELQPDTYGRLVPVVPAVAFAVPQPTAGQLLFGQGVRTLVKEVSVTAVERVPVPWEGPAVVSPQKTQPLLQEETIPFETQPPLGGYQPPPPQGLQVGTGGGQAAGGGTQSVLPPA